MRKMIFSLFSTLFFWIPLYATEEEDDVTANDLYCAETIAKAKNLEEEEEPYSYIQSALKMHWEMVDYLRNQMSVEDYLKADFRYLCECLFPKLFLQYCGFYEDQPECSFHGQGEFYDQIRVTFINGIGNIRQDVLNTVQLVSESHGGINVHYVFRPTGGWSTDIFNATLAKLGFVSPYAFELSRKWKQLIQEMGGPDSNCLIIHYAHSIGGTDSLAAKCLLTAEEAKAVRIHTIGSASIVPPEGFEDAKNYMSIRDGIPCTDVINYLSALWARPEHVVFIGEWNGLPLIEHALTEDVYTDLIRYLGELFQNEFTHKIVHEY